MTDLIIVVRTSIGLPVLDTYHLNRLYGAYVLLTRTAATGSLGVNVNNEGLLYGSMDDIESISFFSTAFTTNTYNHQIPWEDMIKYLRKWLNEQK